MSEEIKGREKSPVEKFRRERERLNSIVLRRGKENIKKFFTLDAAVYKEGALSAKTKELLGLTASLVLRCDDCILYHLIRCYEEKVTDQEVEEAFSVALVVGGSIVIPHLRRAFGSWEELKKKGLSREGGEQ